MVSFSYQQVLPSDWFSHSLTGEACQWKTEDRGNLCRLFPSYASVPVNNIVFIKKTKS